MQALCPNCYQRPQETRVDYDEVKRSSYRVRRSRTQGTRRSFSSTSVYGHVQLCRICATRYQRMERSRTLGWKTANRAFFGVLASGILVALVAQAPGPAGSTLTYFADGVALLAILVLLVGSILVVGARIMRPTATRFLLDIPSTNCAQ